MLVPKNGVITDLVAALKIKASRQDCPAEHIRVYEVHGSKIYKMLHPSFNVTGISDYVSLYAETIPDEELHPGEKTRFINAFQFNKEPSRAHGVPFRFLVKQVCRSPFHVKYILSLMPHRARCLKIPRSG